MALPATLPFQYQLRMPMVSHLSGDRRSQAEDDRDRQLEDYLAVTWAYVLALEARIADLEGP